LKNSPLPEIRALNQHPDYYKARPPANIMLSVRRVTVGSRQEVPFRVNSSGGGKDLAIWYVSADIDLLEDKDVRLKRAGQFVEWMAAQVPEDSRARLLSGLIGNGGIVAYFEEQYINNPPGDYEIIARYTPSTRMVRKLDLVEFVRIRHRRHEARDNDLTRCRESWIRSGSC
jgi:hypothetical protein